MTLPTYKFELVLRSVLPGGKALARAEWERLAWLSPEMLSTLPDDVRPVAGAVMIAARTAVGRVDDAVELSRRELRRVSVAGVVDSTRRGSGVLLVAVAEAHAAAGEAAELSRYASLAARIAGLDPAVMYRALGLFALGLALNGEYAAAREQVARADGLMGSEGWRPSQADFPLLLSQVLIAAAMLDSEELTRLAGRIRAIAPDEIIWSASATSTAAMAHLSRGELAPGLALTREVLHSAGQTEIPTMIRGFTIGIRADLLLLRGDPGQALTLVQDERSPASHALCFAMQRSSALLQLKRDKEALRATDHCLRMGPRHCLRTIAPILLRRAVAFERLGSTHEADDSFAEAFYLLDASGSKTPLLTIPKSEAGLLLTRFLDRIPAHTRVDSSALVRSLESSPGQARERPAPPRLTRREVLLARALSTPTTNAEKADEIGVSVNTVKVHLRNLYLKLGVSNRADALAALSDIGFYDLPEGRD